jgi:hypothetical protein
MCHESDGFALLRAQALGRLVDLEVMFLGNGLDALFGCIADKLAVVQGARNSGF